jgi:hypothetical protein
MVESNPGRIGGEPSSPAFFTRRVQSDGEEAAGMVVGGTRVDDSAALRERYDELRALGYGWGSALILASAPDVDLRLAQRLLERGCPQATAVRILL